MKTLRYRVLAFLAAFVLLGFAGDLVVDAMADLQGAHCASESAPSAPDHEKSPCSHCSCAAHSGTILLEDSGLRIGAVLPPAALLPNDAESRPPRLAGSIDHPPQLG